MNHIVATLHILGVRLRDTVEEAHTTLQENREQGSVTIENVLWAVAVIAFVGIVVAAITVYVTNKSKDIK